MKKSQLRNIIRESIIELREQGPTLPPGTIGDPNANTWGGAAAWANSIMMIVFSHQNPCNFLIKRYNTLYAKLSGYTGGQNPLWQNQMAYKLVTFWTFMDMLGCQNMPNEGINEVRGLKPPPDWCYKALTSSQISEINSNATKIANELKGRDKPINEQYAGNASAWNNNAMAYMVWSFGIGSMLNNHQNPCNFLSKRINHFNNKMQGKGPEWQTMMQTKIDFFVLQQGEYSCGA